MRTTTGTPDFWGKNSISPESLLATKPLTKEPEDSGYEIAYGPELSVTRRKMEFLISRTYDRAGLGLRELKLTSKVNPFSSPEPIVSFSRRRLGTRHEGLWRHTIPEVLDSRTSGLHVWVIRFILNTVWKIWWRSSSRGGITFEELFKALVAFLRLQQKGTIKNIVVLQKDALEKKLQASASRWFFNSPCSWLGAVKSLGRRVVVSP